jgi:hypothetical protein
MATLWLPVLVAKALVWLADFISGALFGLPLSWITAALALIFFVWSDNLPTV